MNRHSVNSREQKCKTSSIARYSSDAIERASSVPFQDRTSHATPNQRPKQKGFRRLFVTRVHAKLGAQLTSIRPKVILDWALVPCLDKLISPVCSSRVFVTLAFDLLERRSVSHDGPVSNFECVCLPVAPFAKLL